MSTDLIDTVTKKLVGTTMHFVPIDTSVSMLSKVGDTEYFTQWKKEYFDLCYQIGLKNAVKRHKDKIGKQAWVFTGNSKRYWVWQTY